MDFQRISGEFVIIDKVCPSDTPMIIFALTIMKNRIVKSQIDILNENFNNSRLLKIDKV